MERRPPAPPPYPAQLPPGTVVGTWRIVGAAGRGVHGAVYRAVPVDSEHASPVALKLALRPRDPRFAREVDLLSRSEHPSIPRLLGHGQWQHPSGTPYPYFAMEWVEGAPLYAWALEHPPTDKQVLRLLAQLARALEALHAHCAVHRDVKGDNVLVRRSDGRALLMDFGSGKAPGALTLTPPAVFPGTPAYRSPESQLFELQFFREPAARYVSMPADDLFALGVTACRLLTGEYPEQADPIQDEQGVWHLAPMHIPPALQGVEAPLRTLVLRMLALKPEERGTAAQLAQALEEAAGPVPAERGSKVPWLLAGAAILMLATWAAVSASEPVLASTGSLRPPEEGTVGVGKAATSADATDTPRPAAPEAVGEDLALEPHPGQAQPDAKGRCPGKKQLALNGACWAEVPLDSEECEAKGGHFVKKSCYVPVAGPLRPTTSGPTREAVPE